ncbi:class I SAM-dependent methyltransferase [Candidatus Collierbacteria bacterium]|nr:class I SAM-dependent methyltransferase [Candidatus Collierbacteria bacterium]
MLSKYLLPPDVFIRHWLVAREIKSNLSSRTASILDVGGSLGEMRKFLPNLKVVTTDVVAGADVLYDGHKLPFQKGEYDYVVSVDTLEHIPAGRRLNLLSQMNNISLKKVIAIAPFASKEHEKYEDELVRRFTKANQPVPPYLAEHRKFGLLTLDQLEDAVKKHKSISYKLVGRVWLDKCNFSIHMFEIKFGKLNKFIYLLKFGWNLIMNLLSPSIIFHPDKNTASRAMIIINKMK